MLATDHLHGWAAGTRFPLQPIMVSKRLLTKSWVEDRFPMTTRRTSGGSNLLRQAPAVTGVLLRQQTRRLWKPTALAQMFARLPRLREVYYEPRRE